MLLILATIEPQVLQDTPKADMLFVGHLIRQTLNKEYGFETDFHKNRNLKNAISGSREVNAWWGENRQFMPPHDYTTPPLGLVGWFKGLYSENSDVINGLDRFIREP